MADTIKAGYALMPETISKLETIAAEMHRNKSEVLDYLVDQEFARRNYASFAVVSILLDGEERTIPALVNRDFKNGKITIVPQPEIAK